MCKSACAWVQKSSERDPRIYQDILKIAKVGEKAGERYQWLKNTRKDVEHHLVVRETQVKTTVRDHVTPTEMAIIQKTGSN